MELIREGWMTSFSGYEISDHLYESRRTRLCRARRAQDDTTVVLKMPAAAQPTPAHVARYRHEFRLLSHVAGDGVVRAHGLERSGAGLTLVLEDLRGFVPLARSFPEGLGARLRVFVRIAEILDRVHGLEVVHKDINPNNILYAPATGEVRLIDFDIASLMVAQEQTDQAVPALEGTIPYMAPEQTGRINRSVDYRADYYSVGVTFYELLTGRLPFASTDPMEVLHGHIARTPVAPHEIEATIPEALSAIVLKLMAKSAEDRYQSASGLIHDLRDCLEQWKTRGTVASFVPGQKDTSSRFRVPEKLHGRERELAALVAGFDEAASGRGAMVLVTGASGVGKTSLVRETERRIAERRGYFLQGKFDQFKRNIPYHALVQAFSQFLRQLAAEPPERLTAFRERLLQALGPNGGVIAAVIPEVEWILGKQKAPVELAPLEAQNRFQRTFLNFVHAIARPEHPMLLFLDDLQWADPPTLHLLRHLLADPTTRHLLLVGGYRDGEVDPAHPLVALRRELAKIGVERPQIELGRLGSEHVLGIVAETLQTSREAALSLARIVEEKTQGTPFFVLQFLTSLYKQRLVYPDRARGQWSWDLAAIAEQGATENVVDFLVAQLERLPEGTKRVLEHGACVGSAFDLGVLSVVSERPPAETMRELWTAIAEGLVVPVGDEYKQFLDTPEAGAADADGDHERARTARFRFLHDRVQHAAYALVDEARKKRVHLAIGRLLRDAPGGSGADLFEVLSHFHAAADLLTDPAERRALAALNLEAGKRARASTAYAPAVRFLRAAQALLEPSAWRTDYRFAFDVHQELALGEYMSGAFERASELYRQILEHAQSPLDKAQVYTIQSIQLTYQNKMPEAIDVALHGLSLLDVRIARKPSSADVLWHLARARFDARGRRLDDLATAEEVASPEALAIVRLLMCVSAPAYQTDVRLYAVVGFTAVRQILASGVTDRSAFAYATYGMLLGNVLGDYENGRRYTDLGLKLLERFPGSELEGRCLFVLGYFVAHWRSPLALSVEKLGEGHLRCMDSGNFVYAAYCVTAQFFYRFLAGTNLAELLELRAAGEAFFQRVPNVGMHFSFAATAETCATLSDPSRQDLTVVDPRFGTEASMSGVTSRVVRAFYLVLKALVLYVFGRFDEALELTRKLDADAEAVVSTMQEASATYLHALCLAACFDRMAPKEKVQALAVLVRNEERMRRWANNCPENFRHLYLTMRAERLRVLGRRAEAERDLERAIAAAKEHGLHPYVGIACEIGQRLAESRGRGRLARTYAAEARDAYLAWGAARKVAELENEVPEIRPRVAAATPADGTISLTTSSTTDAVDIATVVKASQVLVGEVVLSRLLDQMMRFVLEHAGAQAGALVTLTGETIVPRALGRVVGDVIEVREATDPAREAAELPATCATAVRYVARSCEPLVVNDAAADPRFRSEGEGSEPERKAILCVPLLQQGRLVAVMYLENGLVAGAFMPHHVETLRTMASQLAICLENAALYGELEERVAARTRELAAVSTSIRQLFDHMRQAIIAFGPDGRVLGETSRTAKAMFASDDLSGLRVTQLLFPGCLECDPEVVFFEEWLAAVFAAPAEALGELLAMPPSELVLRRGTPEETWLSLEFRPIVDGDTVTRIMLLATDETEKHRLVREAQEKDAEHSRQMASLRKLAAGGGQIFVSFLRSSEERITRLLDILGPEARPLVAADVESLFQFAHTLKGEARAFELRDLERACLEVEEVLAGLRTRLRDGEPNASVSAFGQLRERVALMRGIVAEARDGFVAASPIGAAVLDQVMVRRADLEALGREAEARGGDPLARLIGQLVKRPFGESVAHLVEQVPAWAHALGKRVRVEVGGRDVGVPPDLAARLSGVLTHLLRNGVAHGIETPEGRERAGKEPIGVIRVTCADEGGPVVVTVEDDGGGIDVDALRARAVALGLATESATVGEVLFLPGVSTSARAGEIAGRGVGLGAARAELAEVGYGIEVTTSVGAGTRFVLRPAVSDAAAA